MSRCSKHPDRPQVATCGICERNMCSECLESSYYTKDGKPLCPKCNSELIREKIEKEKKKKTTRIILYPFIVLVNLLAIIIGLTKKDWTVPVLTLMIAGFIPTLRLFFSDKYKSEEDREIERLQRIQDGLDPGSSRRLEDSLAKVIGAIVFSPFALPCLLFGWGIQFFWINKDLKNLQEQQESLMRKGLWE